MAQGRPGRATSIGHRMTAAAMGDVAAFAAPVGRLQRGDRRFGWLMTAPGLAGLVLIVLFPLMFTIFTSGFEYTLLHRSYDTFVGLENYQSAFAENYFGDSLWVTLKFVVAVVLIE